MSLMALDAFAGSNLQWSVIDKSVLVSDLVALNKYMLHMTTCQLNVTESSFEDYSSSIYHDRSEGYFKRDKYEYSSYILGVYTIQDNTCRIVIDSAKKTIMVADPTKSIDPSFSAMDTKSLFKMCTHAEIAKSEKYTYYRLEFSEGYAFTSYEMTIKDSLPVKVVLYYSKKIKRTGSNESTRPRVEIDLDNWTTSVSDKKNAFDTDNYVSKKGDQYFLKPRYAGKFKLSDVRVLTRTTKK